MQTTKFKLANGAEIPAVGFGVFLIDRETTAMAVEAALAAGYRMLDTAAAYNNEKEVGQAIRKSGVPREEIFLTTKLWAGDIGAAKTRAAFDQSLKRLGTDYVDMYMLHWPQPMHQDEILESWQILAALGREGKIRNLGVCNFSEENLNNLIDASGVRPVVNQVELHPFFQQKELRDAHERKGILTQAWSPLGGVRGYVPKAQQSVSDIHSHPVLREIGGKYGKTPAQVVLRWHLQEGISTNSRSSSPGRIAQNFDIFDFELSPGDMARIRSLDTGIRGGDDPQTVDADTYPVTIDPA